MVKIVEVDNSMFVSATKKSIECPFCRREMFFYSMSPKKCTSCKKSLMNYINILTSSMYKLNYHFGIVNEEGIVKMKKIS